MDKKEILQFEEDDTSQLGMNGKQVFFTKRINGKTTHNKQESEESKTFENKKQDKKQEIYIELENPLFKENKPTENIEVKKVEKKKVAKAKKRRKKIKRLMRLGILLLIIAGTIIFSLVSPVFNITKIEAKGNEKIDSQTILSLSGIHEGKNIFRISKKDITQKLKENSYIEEVNIKRILPGTIEIDVKERKIAYQVKVINSYVYLDYQGYILEVASKVGKVPEIEGFTTEQDKLLNGKRLSNEDINKLKVILKIKETATSIDIWEKFSKIKIENNKYIVELKKENKIAYLGDATDLTNKMNFLKAILEDTKKETGKIFLNGNFSTGFKPYFREEKN